MSYSPSRRHWLKVAFGGASSLGVRALASGLPLSVLLNPRSILAQTAIDATQANLLSPQYLVIATSDSGEPMNCNVPGMYEDSAFVHPKDASMAATGMTVGGRSIKAALPWSTLPANVQSRTCFFHHSTGSFQHGTMGAVNTLQGVMTRNNMLTSTLSGALQERLGTIQAEPITMVDGDSEYLTFSGKVQPNLGADALKSILATAKGLEDTASLQKLRDRDLDAIYSLVKAEGKNPAQVALIDQWANSQVQARSMPAEVISALTSINDNSIDSRFAAALALIKTKLTPVINIKLRMGGDNHNDPNLNGEARSQTDMIGSINKFLAALGTAGLSDSVTFATLTNFGRTNSGSQPTSGNGRDHNGNHTCNVLIGKNFKSSLIGGATLKGRSAMAQDISSTSGTGGAGGDISVGDSLAAFGITLAAGVGADTQATVALMAGTPIRVKAALAS